MRAHTAILALVAALPACANDPLYIPGPMRLEAGFDEASPVATAQLQLPIARETMLDAAARAARTAELGVDVPYVKVGDLEVSVEWRIRNLTAEAGEARIQLNGANEYFAYEPAVLAVGLDDDDPRPPGLDGDVPLHVPAMGTIRGVFREDQLREASIDLDQITRGNVNPFRATLTTSRHLIEFAELAPQTYDENGEPLPQPETGVVYPREAFAQLVRIDLVFTPTRHMALDYTVRVRDVRGIMHELLDAAATETPDELAAFAPATYTPPAPPP